jgi:membrane protease YdiL (CAAX protease family)
LLLPILAIQDPYLIQGLQIIPIGMSLATKEDSYFPLRVISQAGMDAWRWSRQVNPILRYHRVGFKRAKFWPVMIGFTFLSVFFLQLLHIGVTMPILNRLTGRFIDYSGFANLKGNLRQLFLLMALSWTLAALGEKIVYRSYLQKLLGDLFGSSLPGALLTVVISSLLFGMAHTEQGIIGFVVTTIGAIVFSWLDRRFNDTL